MVLLAFLVCPIQVTGIAYANNYPVREGVWVIERTEVNGVTRRFDSELQAFGCSGGPHMEFRGDARSWLGISSFGLHKLHGMTQDDATGRFSVNEGSGPYDARRLEIIDESRIKIVLNNGLVMWLTHCPPN